MDNATELLLAGNYLKERLWIAYSMVLLVVFLILLYLRSTISMIACPLGMVSDGFDEIYETPSLLKKNFDDSSKCEVLLDISVSTLVTCLAILGWWSTWSLADNIGSHKLLGLDVNPKWPGAQHILWHSLVSGYALCALVYGLQFALESSTKYNGEQLSYKYKFGYVLLTCIGTVGCVCSWRGLWSLLDVYTEYGIPKEPHNFLITCLTAVALMIIFGCFNTSTSRGVGRLQVENVNGNLPFDLELGNMWLKYYIKNKSNNPDEFDLLEQKRLIKGSNIEYNIHII